MLTFRTVALAPPGMQSSTSLDFALRQRQTIRAISGKPLSIALLSNLLWAACGVNRQDGPFGTQGSTAASASNSREIDVYIAAAGATFIYAAGDHLLRPVAQGDLRKLAMTPGQPVQATAPVHLIYVADVDRLTHTAGFDEPGLHDPEVQKSYYFVDTGLIAGNVYLFAAAHGLAAWFHNCDRESLAVRLELGANQRVLFAQSVGYPDIRN